MDEPSGRRHHPETCSAWRIFWWAALFVDLLLLGLLALQTYRSQESSIENPGVAETGDDQLLASLFVLAVVATWLTTAMIARADRQTAALALLTSIGTATTAIVLGLASYLPCVSGPAQLPALMGWVLYLFTGSFEEGNSPGAACADLYPPGLVLARTTALVAVFGGAVAALATFWRGPINRMITAYWGDVDVVVGLNSESLPLVEALIRENQHRPRREDWLARNRSNWSRQDLWELVRPRTRVVVFAAGASKEHQDRVRGWGAVVLLEDPSAESVVRRVICTRPWRSVDKQRAAIRRFYAVDRTSQVNLKAYVTVKKVLNDMREALGSDNHEKPLRRDRIVPRISIRMDSARDAREWRLREVAALSNDFYSDSLCTERLMAAAIVDDFIDPDAGLLGEVAPSTVWVYGGGTFGLALAEELAWQIWARYEVAVLAPMGAVPVSATKPKLERLVFLGPGADRRADEWEAVRGPYQWPQWALEKWWFRQGSGESGPSIPRPILSLFDVESVECASPYDIEDRLKDEATKAPGQNLYIFAEESPEVEEVARRLAYLRGAPGLPSVTTYLLTVGVEGREVDTRGNAGTTGLRRVGPALVRRVNGVPVRSSDIATRLARQQHRSYLASRGEGWKGPQSPKDKAKVTAVDWAALGAFFRHENIRQVWSVLQAFGYKDDEWQWGLVASSGSVWPEEREVFDPSHDNKLNDLAQNEHERWKQMRHDRGWSYAEERNDPLRRQPLLREWEGLNEEERQFDKTLLLLIIARLYALGLVPVRTQPDGLGSVSPVYQASS